jgi:hypothetical protein
VKKYINVYSILRIEVEDQKSAGIWYKPERKNIFGKIKPEYFYDYAHYPGGCVRVKYSRATISKGYIIDSENGVYHKPKLTVVMSDERKHNKWFDTYAEALAHAEKLAVDSGLKYIIV